MAGTEITYTAARIGLVDPIKAKVKSYVAHAAITRGQAVYCITATGKAGLATAAAATNLAQFRGLALNTVGAGQAVDVVEEGEVYGFTLTGVDYDAAVMLHDTPGMLSSTDGSVAVRVGRCVPMADKALTKVLKIFVRRETSWS